MRKNYLLQIQKNGSEHIALRHIEDIYLESPIVPLSKLNSEVSIILWKCVYAHDYYSEKIEDIKDYVKYDGEIKFS